MVRITTAINPRFKRFFHNPADGTTARVCRSCGAHVYGRNAGICLDCLAKMKKGAQYGKR